MAEDPPSGKARMAMGGQRGTTWTGAGWACAARGVRAAAVVGGCALVLLIARPALGQPAAPAGSGDASQTERRLLLPSGSATTTARKSDGSIVNTVVSLGVVLGLIFGCAAAFRKLSGARGPLAAALGRAGRAPSGLLEVLARYPIGRGQTLVLLRLDRRVLLLSQSVTGRFGCSASFTLLCEVTEAEDVASILAKTQDEEGASMAARFRSLLSKFDEPGDELEEEPWLPRRAVGESEDRAELLDETVEAPVAAGPLRLARGGLGAEAGGAEGSDAVGSLRRRLETLRLAEGG